MSLDRWKGLSFTSLSLPHFWFPQLRATAQLWKSDFCDVTKGSDDSPALPRGCLVFVPFRTGSTTTLRSINLSRKLNKLRYNVGPLNKIKFTLIITSTIKNICFPIYFLTVQITFLMSCLQGIYYCFTSLRLNYNWAMISCSRMEVAQQIHTWLLPFHISRVHFCYFCPLVWSKKLQHRAGCPDFVSKAFVNTVYQWRYR